MRLLFIRLSSLGDVVLTTPAVRAAREALPDATLAVMTSAAFVPLFASNPHVNRVIPVDRELSNRSAGELFRIGAELRRHRFDVSVDFQRKAKTAFLTRIAGIPRRIGSSWMDTDRIQSTPDSHASQRALSALTPLGIRGDDLRLEVHVSEEDSAAAKDGLTAQGVIPGEQPILGIFPGAGWRPRAWMPERFAEIARRAIEEWDARIVLVGAAKERDLVDAVRANIGVPVATFMDTPLGVLAGILRHCDRFLSNDTGPMHLAMAVGTPTVALFGPGDFARFAPRVVPHVGIREPIACSPCKQFRDHCRNNACMRLITTERVWESLEDTRQAVPR